MTNLTIRVTADQKQDWMRRARAIGMSLGQRISYVMDRTEVVISMRVREPRRRSAEVGAPRATVRIRRGPPRGTS